VARAGTKGWDRLGRVLGDLVSRYRLVERRWDSPVTVALGRQSVAHWLDQIKADEELRSTARGLRGFFLADPEQLSLLALVDQFAELADSDSWGSESYRIDGGNDRLAQAMAAALGERVHLRTEVAALSQRGRGVRASVRNSNRMAAIDCDYVVCAVPASLLRRIPIAPALPSQQHDAIANLKYGAGSRDQDAAAILQALLACEGTASRVRLGILVGSGLGRQRGTTRASGHPVADGRRLREHRD
jgi:hypothetical protein